MFTPTTLARGTNSGELKRYFFSPEEIPAVWPEMDDLLQSSIRYSHGTLTSESLHAALLENRAKAICTIRDNRLALVLIVSPIHYATYSSMQILACSGSGLKEAMQHIDALEAWALTQGCVEIEAWCRPAMVRLSRRLGWQQKTVIVSRDLRRKLQ